MVLMKVKSIVLTLIIPLIILLTNFSLLAFNEHYYEKQYVKNGIYNKIPKEQVDEATTQLINYLEWGKELQGDYFNQKEKLHLQDVRNIVKTLMIALCISIVAAAILAILLFIKNRRMLGISLIAGGSLTILLIIIFFLLLTNFDYTFIKFHGILFTNNLWMLNPATDRLIVMFPENFFYDITQDIVVRSMFTALATTAMGFVLLPRKNNKHLGLKQTLK
jgi:integral membrane protein (TIGR01906 family)